MKIKEWTIWTAGLIVFFCIIISIIYMAEKSAKGVDKLINND